MKITFNCLFLFWASLLVFPFPLAFCDPPQEGGYYLTNPDAIATWKTLLNGKYGFSINYPSGENIVPPHQQQNAYAEEEIELPTTCGKYMMTIYTFTDDTVNKWNNNFTKGNCFVGLPFEYSMKDLYQAVHLPFGARTKAFPTAKIFKLCGEKVICVSGNEEIKYFFYRGKNRWVEIDEYLLTYPTDFAGIRQVTKDQFDSEKAVLKTLRFFKPKG